MGSLSIMWHIAPVAQTSSEAVVREKTVVSPRSRSEVTNGGNLMRDP